MFFDIQISVPKKLKKLKIKENRSFSGYWGIINRNYIYLSENEKTDFLVDYFTINGLNNKKVTKYSIENFDISSNASNTPLVIQSSLITNDLIFDLMGKFLGSEFFCGSYCASRLLPGAPGQEMHLDYPYWDFYKSETFPLGLNSSFPQNCQVTIPLDECSALSGATGYIPGSQKKLHYPNANDDFSNKQQMIGSPGDIIFFNGNCWHGAMPNKSQNQRAAILIEFLPKYIKPVEDLVSYLDESFKKNSNDRIKQLLGLQYPYPKIMDVSKSVNDIGIGYKAKN